MSKRIALGSLALVAGLCVVWIVSRKPAAASDSKGSSAPVRQGVELTVYADDFCLVKEVRPVQLAQGPNHLSVQDVSKQMDPQSVLLKWQNPGANPPELVAHAYDLGVSGGDGLMKRFLGKEVELVRYGQDGHEAERQAGRLMVGSGGGVVIQTDGKFYIQPPGTIVASANGDIVPIPQLSVQAVSPSSRSANLEVAYLTRGLSWSADYVATLAPQNSSMGLECWATVKNRSGVDYPGAKVSLIAGTPNRAARDAGLDFAGEPVGLVNGHKMLGWTHDERRAVQLHDPFVPIGRAQPAGEFYAYPIKNPTSVAQEQMNRLMMLTSPNLPVKRDYSAHAPTLSAWGYQDDSWGTAGSPKRGNVQVGLTFFNKEKDGLGAPLPQGSIRFYEPDKGGTLRYAGAATIPATPKDQKINLTLSRSFDIFTEWRHVSTKKINKRTVRKELELILHNEKATPADLRIVQPLYGKWAVTSESHKHVKLDATTVQWTVKIPAEGKTTLKFAVDLGA